MPNLGPLLNGDAVINKNDSRVKNKIKKQNKTGVGNALQANNSNLWKGDMPLTQQSNGQEEVGGRKTEAEMYGRV